MARTIRERFVVFSLLTLTLVLFSGCSALDDPLDELLKEGYPLIESINPSTVAVGTKVLLEGRGFGTVQGSGNVKVYAGADGSAINAHIESWAADRIEFRVPPSSVAAGTPIVVEVVNDLGFTCPYPVYIMIAAPTNG